MCGCLDAVKGTDLPPRFGLLSGGTQLHVTIVDPADAKEVDRVNF